MQGKIKNAFESSFIDVCSFYRPNVPFQKFKKQRLECNIYNINMFRLNYEIETPLTIILPFELTLGDKIEVSCSGGILFEDRKDLFEERGKYLGINVKKASPMSFINSRCDYESVQRKHKLTVQYIPRKIQQQLEDKTTQEEKQITLTSDKISRSHCTIYLIKYLKPSYLRPKKCRSILPIKSKIKKYNCCGLASKKRLKGKAECIFQKTLLKSDEYYLRMRYRLEKTLLEQYSHIDVLLVAQVEYSPNYLGRETENTSETKNYTSLKEAHDETKNLYKEFKDQQMSHFGSTYFISQQKFIQSKKFIRKKELRKKQILKEVTKKKMARGVSKVKKKEQRVVREYTIFTQTRKLDDFKGRSNKLVEDPDFYILHHKVKLRGEGDKKQTVEGKFMSIRYYLHVFLSEEALNFKQIIGKTEITFYTGVPKSHSLFDKGRARNLWEQIQGSLDGMRDFIYLPYSKVSLNK